MEQNRLLTTLIVLTLIANNLGKNNIMQVCSVWGVTLVLFDLKNHP